VCIREVQNGSLIIQMELIYKICVRPEYIDLKDYKYGSYIPNMYIQVCSSQYELQDPY
jgi:hypothetical protein